MNTLSKLLPCLLLLVIFSCNEKTDPSLKLLDERAIFLEGKSNEQQKEDYRELSFESKKILWTSKLEQLESIDLSLEHLELISSIKFLIIKSNSEENLATNPEFQEIGIALSKITSGNDFIQMFLRLDDYSPTNTSHYRRLEYSVTKKLEQDFLDKNNISGSSNRTNTVNSKPDCNCDWTCGDGLCQTSDNCEATSGGCGFLWLFRCSGYDTNIGC